MRLTYVIPFVLLQACDAAPLGIGTIEQPLTFGNTNPYNLSAGNNNDYAFTTPVALVYPHASGSTITGIDLSNGWYNYGDVLWIVNQSTADYATLTDDDTNSTAAYRLHLPDDRPVVIGPGRSYPLMRDYTNGWEALAMPGLDVVATSAPSRSINTAFQPSTTHTVLGHWSVRIATAVTVLTGSQGRVELRSDSSNPPTTVRARCAGGSAAGVTLSSVTECEMTYAVPIGDWVRLFSVDEAGTPTYSVTAVAEQTL